MSAREFDGDIEPLRMCSDNSDEEQDGGDGYSPAANQKLSVSGQPFPLYSRLEYLH